jgi:hypothetical protein
VAKNYASVDRFLEEHVRIVWELGDEIRLWVLSGVGMTFDLAFNNPAGMVALVEAVESDWRMFTGAYCLYLMP